MQFSPVCRPFPAVGYNQETSFSLGYNETFPVFEAKRMICARILILLSVGIQKQYGISCNI